MLAGGLYERRSGAAGQPLGGYRRRAPERTVLHELVADHAQTLIADEADPEGGELPRYSASSPRTSAAASWPTVSLVFAASIRSLSTKRPDRSPRYRRLADPADRVLNNRSPATLEAHYAFYRALMFGPGPLTR